MLLCFTLQVAQATLEQLLPYLGPAGERRTGPTWIVVCSDADAHFCVVCLLRLFCSLSLQVGQATLEQLLPYLGPAEDMQAQFKAAHQKLLTEIDQLKIANLDETGGGMSFWVLMVIRGPDPQLLATATAANAVGSPRLLASNL